jgi:hypothetical protein
MVQEVQVVQVVQEVQVVQVVQNPKQKMMASQIAHIKR